MIRYAGIDELYETRPESTAETSADNDDITNWRSDFNADGETTALLEGQLLMRHLLGTYPADALIHNIQGIASENHMLVGSDTNSVQLDSWLAQGKAVGGFGGSSHQTLNAFAEGLSFIENL